MKGRSSYPGARWTMGQDRVHNGVANLGDDRIFACRKDKKGEGILGGRGFQRG